MIQSAIRFSWAISLFGLQQSVRLISALSSGRPLDVISDAFDQLSRTAEAGLRFGAASVRHPGKLPEPVVDLPLRVAVRRADATDRSRSLLRGTLAALQEGAETLRVLAPSTETQIACREFKNKLEAFEHFQYAYAILDLEEKPGTIDERVVRVARLDAYRGVWVMEGLGYALAEEWWDDDSPPRGLLRDPQIDALPRASWIPLHTGMGLLIGRRVLGDGAWFGDGAKHGEGKTRLARFIELCNRNARQGYADAMFEALGLIVRNLHPDALADVDAWLRDIAPQRRAVFWHGAGRALYFNLTQSLSGAGVLWRGLEKIRRDAPDALARLNALAGLSWALSLVNIRHPEVVEIFLRDYGDRLTEREQRAFSNGVASATTLWFDAVGRDPYLERFVGHQADPYQAELQRRWRTWIAEPCEASYGAYEALLQGDGPGRLFHYERSLDEHSADNSPRGT